MVDMATSDASDPAQENTPHHPVEPPVATRPVGSHSPAKQPLKGTKPSFGKRPAGSAVPPGRPDGKAGNADAPSSTTPAAKGKNRLFIAACSAITAVVAAVMLSRPGKLPVQPAVPVAPATPVSPVPAPVVSSGQDPESISERLAARVAEQKRAAESAVPPPARKIPAIPKAVTPDPRAALIAAAESGNSAEWLALAEDYLREDTEANRAAARPWLEKVAGRQTSRGFLLLGGMEETHGEKAKAVDFYVQGAASISSGKNQVRDAKLEEFARRLDGLGEAEAASRIRSRINGADSGPR